MDRILLFCFGCLHQINEREQLLCILLSKNFDKNL
nr:MAG TPA: hypothetical protein [Caudoviricetes sp.]